MDADVERRPQDRVELPTLPQVRRHVVQGTPVDDLTTEFDNTRITRIHTRSVFYTNFFLKALDVTYQTTHIPFETL